MLSHKSNQASIYLLHRSNCWSIIMSEWTEDISLNPFIPTDQGNLCNSMNLLNNYNETTSIKEFSVNYLVKNNSQVDPLHILIIDDGASDRELFTQLIQQNIPEAYIVTETGSGHQGYKLCLTEAFDCILLDYFLPDMEGMAFLKKLEDHNIDIPVVMLTGHGNEITAVEALQHGAADYIPKRNVSTESLRRSIANAVEKNHLKRKIDKQNKQLEENNRELTKKHEEILRFYHTVSHELKTPLTSMKEFVSIILDNIAGPISDDQKEYLGYVNESCMQMTNDINDLLDVTRMETGKFNVNLAPLDINEVITLVSQLMKPISDEKGVDISLELNSNLNHVLADSRRIEQVLTNLLSNAIKFTDAGGKITITTKIDTINTNYIEIAVEDTGCGIKKKNIDKLFNRLYQVESGINSLGSENSSKAGLGLGLTIVKEIIELHSGNIWVASDIDQGSKFSFTLQQNSPTITQIDTKGT